MDERPIQWWDAELTEWAARIQWMTEQIGDVMSDFSAIHRVRDPLAMPGRDFFVLAHRLHFYPGVVQARKTPVLDHGAPPPDDGAPRNPAFGEFLRPGERIQHVSATGLLDAMSGR